MGHWIETTGTLDFWQIAAANAFLAGSITALAMAFWVVVRRWRGEGHLTKVAAITALALVVRVLIAPKWVATVFIGYKATQQSIDLFPLPHYGAGATVLYHHLMAIFGQDHLVIIWSNTVMGILSIPLIMNFAQRMTQSHRVGMGVGLLVALAPILIRNDTSDANNVPCLLWLFCGLTLLIRARVQKDRWFLWWACFPLGLAVVSRPEMVVIVGGLVLTTMVAFPGLQSWRARFIDATFFIPFAALTIPHWMHIWRAVKALRQGRNIQSLDRYFAFIPTENNAVIDPNLFGVAYTLAAVAGTVLLWKTNKRFFVCMWLVIAAALIVYSVDLDRANLARAHVPATLLVTILAGQGLAEILSRWRPFAGFAVAVWAVVLLSNVPPALTLWQPTNEQTEERLVREALDAIDAPDGFTLIRLNYPDVDRAVSSNRGHTHFHFPDYLVQNAERRGRVLPISAWLDGGTEKYAGPIYFFRGVRCYAEFRYEDDPVPQGRNEHPLCRALLKLPDIKPVFEHTVPNYGNVWINYYGDSADLVVGLYRLGAIHKE